jgi:hypothetical protein
MSPFDSLDAVFGMNQFINAIYPGKVKIPLNIARSALIHLCNCAVPLDFVRKVKGMWAAFEKLDSVAFLKLHNSFALLTAL